MTFKFPSLIQTSIIFILNVSLLKSDNSFFKVPCLVTLSSDGLKGNTTKNNMEGFISFEVYFETGGKKDIKANCSKFQTTTEADVSIFTTPDDLCLNPFNSTHCQVCRSKAYPINGKCECTKDSLKSKTNEGCSCISNSFEYENACYANKRRFFKPSQLHGYFSKDFKKIIVDFDTRTNAEVGSSCLTQISFPDILKDLIINCLWDDSSFIILLSKVIIDSNLTIKVNSFEVNSLTNTESYNIEELSVIVMKKFNYSAPTAEILAPSYMSFKCSSDLLEVSSKEKTSLYIYSWTASSSPFNEKLESLINSTKSPEFTVSTQLLPSTNLKIFLKVFDPIFNLTSEAFHNLSISSEKTLIVSFSNPGPLRYSSSSEFLIQSVVRKSCGTLENYQYTWSYSLLDNSPDINFQKILMNGQRPGTLKISKNMLPIGQYSFKVNISSESISGSSSINLEIYSSPLILTFSKSNGTVSENLNVVVTANGIDSDNLIVPVNVAWVCNEQNSGLMTRGNDLVLISGSFKEEIYTFTATAKTSDQRVQKTLALMVNNKINIDISLRKFERKVNIDSDIKLVTVIQSTGKPKFYWRIEEGVKITDDSYPYLKIPAMTLEAGKAYKVTVQAELSDEDKVNSSIWIDTNMIPVCLKVLVESNRSIFKITALDCQDPDNDTPLTYIFGIINGDKRMPTTNKLFSNSLTTTLPFFSKKVFCKVCDNLNSCTIYDSSDIHLSSRHLQNFSTEFSTEIRNPELVPINIIIFSNKANTFDELQLVFDVFYNYFIEEIMDEDTFNIFVECFQAIFNKNKLCSDEMMRNATDFLLGMAEMTFFDISKENSEKLLKTIKLYKDRFSIEELLKIIRRIANRMINEKLPQEYLEVEEILVLIKEIGNQLPGLNLIFDSISLEIPLTSIFDESTVYDIQIIKLQKMNSSVFDIKLFKSGTYKEFSFKSSALDDSSAELDQVINIKINGEFDENLHYVCKFLNESYAYETCKVDKITEKDININVTVEGSFMIISGNYDESESLKSSDKSCAVGYYNIGIMLVIISFCLGLALVSLIFGRKGKNESDLICFGSIYLPSSFFYETKTTSKIISFLEMLTIFLILLLIMNAFLAFLINNPEDLEFNEDSVRAAAIAWAICQIFSIFIYLALRTNKFLEKRILFFSILFGCVLLICFSLIITISMKFCLGKSLAVLQLYLILLGLEILIEMGYSAASVLIIRSGLINRSKSFRKNSGNQETCRTTDRGKELFRLNDEVPPFIIHQKSIEGFSGDKKCFRGKYSASK